MDLDMIGEICPQNRDSERTAELAREVDQTGRLLRHPGLDVSVCGVVNRGKEESQSKPTDEQREPHVVFAGLGGEVRHLPHGDEEEEHAQEYQDAWIDQGAASA